MQKVKIRNHEFTMSDITKIVHYAIHDTLIFLGPPKTNNKQTFCLGVGYVRKIQKGKDYDLVGIDFGRGYTRDIFVANNHARRQIFTLKKGQLAWFYGVMRVYTENGKTKSCLYAKGFQGWYVPKVLDIEKIDPNDYDTLEEENESKIDFIDNLLKGNE